MNEQPNAMQKVGESAFFIVDYRSYSRAISQFDPVLASQTVVYTSEPAEVLELPEPSPTEVPDKSEQDEDS